MNRSASSRKRVSIKDIADAAGVSHPTVSRALRGQGRMADDTRARIVAIARDLGYTPSLMARGLVTRQSFSIGLVVTNFADPFYAGVAQGLESEARRHGYSVFLASTENEPSQEIEVARGFHARQVDAIVVASSRLGNQYVEHLEDAGVPIVMINTHAESSGLHAVYNDDYAGARTVAEYLISQGHQRIAFLGNRRAGRAQKERQCGWDDALAAAGRTMEVLAWGPTGRYAGGAEAVTQLLHDADDRWGKPPDALCCYNDTMAIGAMHALRQHDFNVPDDLACTGFDDIDVAAYVRPALTTLRQARFQLGVEAMRILLDVLQTGEDGAPIAKTLPGKLIVRESA